MHKPPTFSDGGEAGIMALWDKAKIHRDDRRITLLLAC